MPTYKITLEDYTPKVKRDIRGLKGYKYVFAGEIFLYNKNENALFFKIDKPYYSAGKHYGWNPPIGLGICKQALIFALRKKAKLCVFIGNRNDRYYETTAERWYNFSKKHNSIEQHGKTTIYIIQFSRENFNTILIISKTDQLTLSSFQ